MPPSLKNEFKHSPFQILLINLKPPTAESLPTYLPSTQASNQKQSLAAQATMSAVQVRQQLLELQNLRDALSKQSKVWMKCETLSPVSLQDLYPIPLQQRASAWELLTPPSPYSFRFTLNLPLLSPLTFLLTPGAG